MLLFPPQVGLKQLEFISSDGCVDKSIIALTLKRMIIWMKAKHSLRNFVALNSNCFKPACGGKVAHLKMTLPQQNSPRIKTPYPYLMNLVSNYLEKNILSDTVKITVIQSRISLKLRIKIVAFFLGHLYSYTECITTYAGLGGKLLEFCEFADNISTFTDFHKMRYPSCLMQEIMSLAIYFCFHAMLNIEVTNYAFWYAS